MKSINEITQHIGSYPEEVFNLSLGNDPRTLMLVTEITIRGSQVESKINEILADILIDMKYMDTKFSSRTFEIIDHLFAIWSLWYKEIVLLHKYISSRCDSDIPYPDEIVNLAVNTHMISVDRINRTEINGLIINPYSILFEEFKRDLESMKVENGFPDNVTTIGKSLLTFLESSISLTLSIDSFIKGENQIYILPRVGRLRINFIRLVLDSFPNSNINNIKVYMFDLDPVLEEKVDRMMNEALPGEN